MAFPFVLIWPTARSTSLAGACIASAECLELTSDNPAVAGLLGPYGISVSGGPWLPGLYPGMSYTSAAGNYALPAGRAPKLGVGVDLNYINLGQTDVINESNEFVGRFTTWRGSFGAHAGISLLKEKLGLGLKVKYLRSQWTPDWVWSRMPELGIDAGGSAGVVAADFGILHRPLPSLSWGLVLANVGPTVRFSNDSGQAPLPLMLRLGLSWRAVQSKLVSLQIGPQVDWPLTGVSDNTAGTTLQAVVGDMWKSLGIEAGIADFLFARTGYFEDVGWQRGGIVMERNGENPIHYGVGDVLTKSGLGKFKSLGLCWGFGIGWKQYIRLDFASDAMAYDFPTANWKVSLSAGDIAGFVRELSRLRVPDIPLPRLPPEEFAPGPQVTFYTGSGVLLSGSGRSRPVITSSRTQLT